MRKLLSFSCFLLLQIVAFSQTLTLEGVAPNLYLEHTVAPKENFYSIGRLYNQAPKTIAAYNNVAMEKGLSIGQHIKIPLNEQNYDISGKSNTDEKLLPLTHPTAPVHTTTSETIKQTLVDIPVIDNQNVEKNTGIAIPDAGAFALQFPSKSGTKINNLIGTAASFKSTSGWQDKKYYALINDIAPGTIIKVTSSDKVVYAKVLGSMPEMKENSGLMLRLSNSAASHLGIVDSNFSVEIAYYQ